MLEIMSVGLVPIIEVASHERQRPSRVIVGEQFDYITGKFVALQEKA